VKFSFPPKFEKWPRQGSEGIVAPIICHHPEDGEIPSILKFFNQEIPGRNKRFEYLVDLGLTKIHDWLYSGVPYLWIDKRIHGIRIHGHAAKHIGAKRHGDDFRIFRENGQIDNFTRNDRREMAAQLCCAIIGLEKLGIVHGDLSPANIVIGKQGKNDVHCVLIDYDGYHSDAVKPLPRTYNGKTVRLLGSPGYQHPSLIRKMAADRQGTDEKIYVENDRFALGVLCFELMVYTSRIERNLNRTTILDPGELANNKVGVPEAVKGEWPEGYHLLEKMVHETNTNRLPSPDDWLRALGFQSDWATKPLMKIERQVGNEPRTLVRRVEFSDPGGGKGDLSPVDPRLMLVHYAYSFKDGKCEKMVLYFPSYSVIFLWRDGQRSDMRGRDQEIVVKPGDVIMSNHWVFSFSDGSTDSN